MADKFELNSLTPAPPAGKANVVWQSDANGNISGYVTPPVGTTPVASVFGRTGAVVAAANDYDVAQVTNAVSTAGSYTDPTWLTIGWNKVNGKPSTFPPALHSHAASDVTSGVLAPERLGSGSPSASNFLRGDGQWAAPSGGSGGGGAQTPWTSHIDADGYELREAGRIGIGTASPLVPLHIVGGGAQIEHVRASGAFGSATIAMSSGGAAGPGIGAFHGADSGQLRFTGGSGGVWQVLDGAGAAFAPFAAGEIYSQNGGFKFPDGSIQTTAAAGAGAVKDEGTALPLRAAINFVGGGVTAADDPANNCTVVTVGGGGGGAGVSPHRYWRLYMTAGAVSACAVMEMELRSTAGGGDKTGSGTASSSSNYPGWPPSQVFDDNTGTGWSSADSTNYPHSITYDFGSAASFGIVQIVITPRASIIEQAPTAFQWQWSDDGIDFTTQRTYTGITWPGGTPQTFDVGPPAVFDLPSEEPAEGGLWYDLETGVVKYSPRK